jgi:hypothetical protein
VTEIAKRTLAQEAAFRHSCWPDALRFVAQQLNIGAVILAREPSRSKIMAAPEIDATQMPQSSAKRRTFLETDWLYISS